MKQPHHHPIRRVKTIVRLSHLLPFLIPQVNVISIVKMEMILKPIPRRVKNQLKKVHHHERENIVIKDQHQPHLHLISLKMFHLLVLVPYEEETMKVEAIIVIETQVIGLTVKMKIMSQPLPLPLVERIIMFLRM